MRNIKVNDQGKIITHYELVVMLFGPTANNVLYQVEKFMDKFKGTFKQALRVFNI